MMGLKIMQHKALDWLKSVDKESYSKGIFSEQLTETDSDEDLLLHFLLFQVDVIHNRSDKFDSNIRSKSSDVQSYIQIAQNNFSGSDYRAFDVPFDNLRDNLESNFFPILNSILLCSNLDERVSLLEGLLIYLVQSYFLTYASLVAIELTKLEAYTLVDNYCDFLSLHQGESGTFGLLNPLKPNPFKTKKEYNEWLYLNTLYGYVFLEYRNRGGGL